MDTSATIDLGLVDSRPWDVESSQDGVDDPRPGWRRRRFGTLLLVVAVVIGLSGPPPGPLHVLAPAGTLALAPGGNFQLFPDDLYTFVQAAGGSRIAAYSLAGAVAWHARLPPAADLVVLAEATDVTLVQFEFPVTSDVGAVWALDRRTGRRLWQQPDGRIIYAHGRRVLMTEIGEDGMWLALFDAITGRVLWHRPLDYSWDLSPVTADGSAIFALSPTGELHQYAIDDQGTEHDATLTGDAFGRLDQHTLVPSGGNLVVTAPTTGTANVSGYRIGAITGVPGGPAPVLAPRWTVTIVAPGRIGGGHGPGPGTGVSTAAQSSLSLVSCGVVLCVYFGVNVWGINPASGAIGWSQRSEVVSPVGDWLVAQPINAANLTDSTVTDPQSGQTLLHLGPWSPTSTTSASTISATFAPAATGSRTPLFMAQASVAITAGRLPASYVPPDARASEFTAVLSLLQPPAGLPSNGSASNGSASNGSPSNGSASNGSPAGGQASGRSATQGSATEGLSSGPRLRIIGVITVPGFECQVAGDYLACSGSAGGASLPPGAGGLVQTWNIRGS